MLSDFKSTRTGVRVSLLFTIQVCDLARGESSSFEFSRTDGAARAIKFTCLVESWQKSTKSPWADSQSNLRALLSTEEMASFLRKRVHLSIVVARTVQAECKWELAFRFAEAQPVLVVDSWASANAAETGPVFDAMNFSSKSATNLQHSHCGLRIFEQLFYMFFKIIIYRFTCARRSKIL